MSDNDGKKGQSGNDGQGRNGSGNGSDAPQGKLEALLNEWDQKNSQGTDSRQPDPKDGKPAGTGEDDLAQEVGHLRSLLEQTTYRSDMDRIVAQIKGDLEYVDAKEAEEYAEYWVNKKADNDRRLVEIWNDRDANKSRFRQVIESMAPEFQEHARKMGLVKPDTDPDDDPDGGAETTASRKGKSESRDDKGLGAAVRSSREAKPSTGMDDVNWAGLSGQEFALKRAEVFRAMKKGTLK